MPQRCIEHIGKDIPQACIELTGKGEEVISALKLPINQHNSIHKSIPITEETLYGKILYILNEVSTDYFYAKYSRQKMEMEGAVWPMLIFAVLRCYQS